jgi:hypothetical protein
MISVAAPQLARLFVLRSLEKAGIEGPGQQFTNRNGLTLTLEIGEYDGGILREFPDDLTASSTRRRSAQTVRP